MDARTLALALGIVLAGTEGLALARPLVAFAVDREELAGPLPRPVQDEVSALRACGCLVTPLTGPRRELLDAAVARLAQLATDKELLALVASKRDFVVERDGAWQPSAEAGLAVRDQLQLAGDLTEVIVLVYGDGPDRRCTTRVAGEGIHAYTRPGLTAVLLRDTYVDASVGAPDGVRSLARTLLHEVLHVLGHRHPQGPADMNGAAYSNSIPVFLGCAAELYPNLGEVRRSCHLAPCERRDP